MFGYSCLQNVTFRAYPCLVGGKQVPLQHRKERRKLVCLKGRWLGCFSEKHSYSLSLLVSFDTSGGKICTPHHMRPPFCLLVLEKNVSAHLFFFLFVYPFTYPSIWTQLGSFFSIRGKWVHDEIGAFGLNRGCTSYLPFLCVSTKILGASAERWSDASLAVGKRWAKWET